MLKIERQSGPLKGTESLRGGRYPKVHIKNDFRTSRHEKKIVKMPSRTTFDWNVYGNISNHLYLMLAITATQWEIAQFMVQLTCWIHRYHMRKKQRYTFSFQKVGVLKQRFLFELELYLCETSGFIHFLLQLSSKNLSVVMI